MGGLQIDANIAHGSVPKSGQHRQQTHLLGITDAYHPGLDPGSIFKHMDAGSSPA
jgi:hypothetical protein